MNARDSIGAHKIWEPAISASLPLHRNLTWGEVEDEVGTRVWTTTRGSWSHPQIPTPGQRENTQASSGENLGWRLDPGQIKAQSHTHWSHHGASCAQKVLVSRSGAPSGPLVTTTSSSLVEGVKSFPLSERAEAPACRQVSLSTVLPEQERVGRSLDVGQDALYLFLHKAWYLALPGPS